VIAVLVLAALAGCGYSGGSSSAAVALGGSVHGGHQPVSGARIQLYAAGNGGVASAAQPLLSSSVESDSNGNFSIPATYYCPSPSSQVYVVARGGNPGLASGASNPNLLLTAMLGACSGLSTAGSISVNEVTTVGSVWPLASYITSSSDVGSASGDPAFVSAVATVPEFVNLTQGTSPGVATSTSYFAENAKLYSLADVLADCVSSTGGTAGDGSPCGRLFSLATPPGGTAPTDTMTAAARIAQNPDNVVAGIFGLVAPDMPFQPTVPTTPVDWRLPLSYRVATPTISLSTGTYVGPQEVTISDATPATTIHYTTDGTVPTSSSPTYSGAIAVSVSTTIQAIAVFQGSTSTVASSTLTIAAANLTPARLAFLQQPTNAVAQATISPAVQVVIEDAGGNPVVTANNPVTLALVGGTGLAGTLTVTPQNGVATFSDLSVSNPGTDYTLSATSSSLSSASSSVFSITAAAPVASSPPVKLAFQQQPTNAVAGATISPAVTVAIEDANGNTVPSATNPVTLTLTGGTGLGGTLTVAPQNGVATFSNLTVSAAGSGYTLSAANPSLSSAVSKSFTISAPAGAAPSAAKLAFSQQPTGALIGAKISPAVRVAVEDSNGNPVTGAVNAVTLVLNGGTGLGGTLTAVPQNGIATFSNLTVSAAGTGETLTANSPDLVSATSTSFAISAAGGGVPAPSPVKLAFVQQPSNALTGATISPAVQVAVQDANGTTATTATSPVTLALVGGTGLGGTLTAVPQNGIATFSNLSVGTAGNYTLSASSPSLTSAASTSFTITAPSLPTAVKLAFSVQPSNALTQATITPAVQVVLQDAGGNTVTSATNAVTLALAGGTGLGGTLTVTPQNGVATFSNLYVSNAGSYTLSASSAGLTTATSASFTVSATATATCSITSFGAVGDGVTNNATAIQNTFNYAATQKCTALIPAGTFAYSGTLTANGIAVTGTGAASILQALDTNNEALTLTGNGGSISNLVMLGTGTTRNVTYQAAMIWVNGATNFTVENVLINGGSCVGIYDAGGQTGLIQNNTVENTLADSITNTNGASNITVKGNHVLNSGDDGVSNNSYLTDPNTVHGITVEGNTILHNVGGRGLEVSGGSDITFEGNYVDNLDGYTDMYIASEVEYKTQNVSNITVTGNTFVDGGPNQGSAIIYNSEPGSTTITGVTLNGNQFVNPKLSAVQLAGSGSETGIVIENNTDFSTSAFSFSSNTSASATQTDNQVLAPSTYTTPLVPQGGGCSFSGC
jgi:hypothetical protein